MSAIKLVKFRPELKLVKFRPEFQVLKCGMRFGKFMLKVPLVFMAGNNRRITSLVTPDSVVVSVGIPATS